MAQTVNIIFGAATVGGTANAITATYSPVLTALTNRRTLSFKAAANNSGAVTFSPDGLTVRSVTKKGGNALVTGDILQNAVYLIQYDSTNTRWELLNPSTDADTTPNLAQVLNEGNVTDEQSIQSNNGESQAFIVDSNLILKRENSDNLAQLSLLDTLAQLYYYDDTAGVEGFFRVIDLYSLIYHDTQINLNAPNVNLPNETASRIAIFDGSKNIKSADTSTYPSLTELAHVKGVTSAIQTQLGNKQPLDATLTALAALTTAANKLIRATGSDTFDTIDFATGTYTPTLTNGANVAASTAYQCQYMRIGDIVTVSGQFDLDPTTAGSNTILRASLPIDSNFGVNEDCGGAANSRTVNQHLAVYGAVANNELVFNGIPSSAANATYNFIAQYRII